MVGIDAAATFHWWKTEARPNTKMGERTLRRLLIIGASAVVKLARRRGASQGRWLEPMLARKPPMLVAVALANKMARTVWALIVNGGGLQSSGRSGLIA